MQAHEDKPASEPLNIAYQEICKLAAMLELAKIPFSIDRAKDGWRIVYPSHGGRRIVCSVIEYTGSYGAKRDLLEISGLLNKDERKYDTVVGFLSADKVYARIEADWERRKKRVRGI